VKIINGHNYYKIYNSLLYKSKNKPYVIIANTIKGKGVKFMENSILWHYKSPNNQELIKAINELE
jgi:transketolase